MVNSPFAICVNGCQIYFENDSGVEQKVLQQGSLLQIIEEDDDVSTVRLLCVNYENGTISVSNKNFLCEQKFLKAVSSELFRFLVSVQSADERFYLISKSHILRNIKPGLVIEFNKNFLKFFNNIICQVIYIGETPEMGVGDFIGIKLLNCSLPLIIMVKQNTFIKKYVGDLKDAIIISPKEFAEYYVQQVRGVQAKSEIPPKPKITMNECMLCKASDDIIYLRNCPHRMCKSCLFNMFNDTQLVELSCNFMTSKNQQCSKLISLEHFIFLYPDLQQLFNEIKEKNQKSCFNCSVKSDNTGNVLCISACEHTICKTCATEAVLREPFPSDFCQFLMENGKVCNAVFEEKKLKAFLDPNDFNSYEERKLVRILKMTPNSRRCKTSNCKFYWIVGDEGYTRYYCKLCKKYNCIKCDAIHSGTCKEFERQILDGVDADKKNELLAKLTDDEIKEHDLVRNGTVENYFEAEKFRLLKPKYLNYDDKDLLWAIRQSDEITVIERLLNMECNFCSELFSENNMFAMITCEHKFCVNCAKTHFTIQITEKTIRDCICPACKLPTLDDNSTESESEYFALMGHLLKNILDEATYDLFDRKTRDRALLNLPNFAWCVKCENGFEANIGRLNAACTECHTVFCTSCNEIWQDQHAGISCQQFKQWKQENDPKHQSEGVAKYLEKNGIECPSLKCKFKYSLAKGGCLHFTCTRCSYQFCFGCRQPMMAGAKCNKYNDCAKKGLHAHHPRNCLTILRDCKISSLEGLLETAGINFTGIPQNGDICQIPIQRETPGKMIDCLCEKPTVNRNIGLCEQHYKEGLIDLIFKSKVDPVDILDLDESRGELIRNHVEPPNRLSTDTDATYRAKCISLIKERIPLV